MTASFGGTAPRVADALRRTTRALRAELSSALGPIATRGRVLEAVATPDRLDFTLIRRGTRQALGEVPIDPAAPARSAAAIAALLASVPGRFDRLELRAAPGRGLTRSLRLPIAARASLRDAVRFDLDRQTPFSEETIHFGAAETAVDRAAGRIEVRLDIIPRGDIDPALAALAAAGLRPDAVRLASDDGPELAPPEALHRPPAWLAPSLAGAVAAVLVLGLGALVLPLHQARSALAEAEAEALAARRGAAEAEALAGRLAAVAAREARLVERRRSQPMAVEILAEATRLVPDDGYLVQFGIEGGGITMTGYARRAAPLLQRIEQSALMAGARFVEPVVPDGRMGSERFALAAEIPARRPPEEAGR